MSDTNLALFIDTNSFLQLKDFNQIAWRTLFPKAELITLFVCSAVIGELDKHKVSTNQRRRDRARKALKLIDDASASKDMTLSVRRSAPTVELAIWTGKPVWTDFPDLDPASADDYLVAAAAATLDGVVFSHDTAPRIRARSGGVRAECPPDDWLLPAEQTDDQRKIGQLTRELTASQNARPQLEIILPPDDPIIIRAVCVPPLDLKARSSLADSVLSESPKHHLVATPYSAGLAFLADGRRLGQTQIDAYEHDYDSFIEKVRSYFVTLHEHVARHALAQMPPGIVANTGNVSAKNLTLTIEVEGSLQLLSGRKDAQMVLGSIVSPTPPKPPSAAVIGDAISLMGRMNRIERDPTGFYWRERPGIIGTQLASFECADFRPGREEDLGVLVRAVEALPSAGRIIVSASAEHHETVIAERAIIFEKARTAWLDPEVQELLPDTVQDAFASLKGVTLPTW